MMMQNKYIKWASLVLFLYLFGACKIPTLVNKSSTLNAPNQYQNNTDTVNTGNIVWQNFYSDPYLKALIDTALHNNQELAIVLQEIAMSKNEISVRKGEYMPFVQAQGGMGIDKVARYTNIGAMEANTEIKPGKEMPDPLPDFMGGLYAKWELDIWNKLHNATKASVNRYLATVQGKNFVITGLVAEVANLYYELLALDNQLVIVRQNIDLYNNALEIVKVQKQAAKVTELAVKKFEAELLNTKSLEFDVKQKIVETENKLNFLLGRYPQPINRSQLLVAITAMPNIHIGLPAQLLSNRPDIQQAEQQLAAAKLDIQVAKAQFYPSLGISAGLGYRAYNPAYLIKTPASLLYSLGADIAAPLVNKNAIKATFQNANARQIQVAYQYERTILNAYVEVANMWAKMDNLANSASLKAKEVDALTASIDISRQLFNSARADYMEVLLTQRDALASRFELIETQKQQLSAIVNIYRALGGGWK